MTKRFAFLHSMRFGIILLVLVMACALAGSLIPQDREVDWYTTRYPGIGGTLLVSLGLHRLFGAWYFVLLVGLLGLNLLLCAVLRVGRTTKAFTATLQAAEALQGGRSVSASAADGLRSWLAGKRFKQRDGEGVSVYYRNATGYFGSFAVHLSLLLILIFGGLVLGLSEVNDHPIMPNETISLDDGTQVTLDNFRIADETGRTDYVSSIRITSPEGFSSGPREISVNHPLTYRSYKYYQHMFGNAGTVTATNTETGGWDLFHLAERSFLSGDGRQGIWYEALFPGYLQDEQGNISPLPARTTVYPDPVYYVMVSDGSGLIARFVFPGETIQVGAFAFSFGAPAYFSVIRVKRIPHPFLELLYASFALMIAGFWLCFFHTPIVVGLGPDRYTVLGKPSGASLEIETFFAEQVELQGDAAMEGKGAL